ncbi:MAG: ferrous iron transport protein B, partial [Lentisphaeria bacterium]|nr:ferrous iron transport protein B [Lentisphaeria bacterium]
FTVQLLEMDVPMVIALNMVDAARGMGISIDCDKLSALLGVPVVETVGHRSEGLDQLKNAIVEACTKPTQAGFSWMGNRGDSHFRQCVKKIVAVLESEGGAVEGVPVEWTAVKLLEKDRTIRSALPEKSLARIDVLTDRLASVEGDTSELIVAGRRYGFINSICMQAVHSTLEARNRMTERIDAVLANRVLGFPILLFLMYLVFKLTFTVGAPMMGWIELGFGWLAVVVGGWWAEGSESLLKSLLVDGVIGGVGGVLIFLPNIVLLFFAIAILEGTGYMARVAFIMDKVMNKIGLHGKSFIPMLVGFGCTVPAIMATRTLESRRDRMTTMLVAPLMSCGARIPIYMLFIPAFFPPAWHAPVMWGIYLIGIVLAIICARLLRTTLFRGEAMPFLMELPPYRCPTLRSILMHMWERAGLYVKKAGTVILAASILLWAASTFPRKKVFERDYAALTSAVRQSDASSEQKQTRIKQLKRERRTEMLSHTASGRLGKALEPILKPLGFDWRIGTALVGAFAAKEVFVAQLGIVYSVDGGPEGTRSIRKTLQEKYSALQGFCVMLFCLISVPCVSTFAVTRRESNSWGWAFFQLGALTALAYLVTLVVYQVGTLAGLGT